MSTSRSWRLEIELLRRCCVLHPSDAVRADLGRRIAAGIDWPRLVELAEWHRLTGLLAYHLDHVDAAVPPPIRDRLRAEREVLVERRRRDRWELRKLLLALDSSDIPVVLLKGTALVETVYAEVPELRPMADLDLLVRETDLDRAESVARDLGYASPDPPALQAALRRHHRHYPPLYNRDGTTCFELHRHIVRRGSVLAFGIEAFWQRSRPIAVDGARARLLAPEDQLTHLLLNLFQDARQGLPSRGTLGKLTDVAEMVRQASPPLDGQAIVERAKTLGVVGPVLSGLLAARQLVDLDLDLDRSARPDDDRARPPFDDPAIDRYVRVKLLAPPGTMWSFHELVEPPDRLCLSNELKSVARVVLRGRRDLPLRHRPWLDRRREHLRSLRAMVGSAIRSPRHCLDHRRVDHWMHRLMRP